MDNLLHPALLRNMAAYVNPIFNTANLSRRGVGARAFT